ncbi:protein FAM187B-like [Ctenodactylus gundi]
MVPRLQLPWSTLLATLWLINLSLPTPWAQPVISCSYKSLCQQALLSGNDIVLKCDHPRALWYFSSILGEDLFLFNSVHYAKNLPGGSLLLINPQPFQAGFYICKDNRNSLVVEYEIDFQDVTTLRVTHKGLGQEPLKNQTVRLGSDVRVFTHWEPWQECNRCRVLGERKRLGYCYVEEAQEKPTPCGLYLSEGTVAHSRLRPEMQVEACLVTCGHAKEISQPYFFFNISQLGKLTSNMWLKCPLASIYR